LALTPDGKRQIWEIEGDARFDRLNQARFRLSNDPGAQQDGTSSEMRRRNVAISAGREPAQPDEASRFRLNGEPQRRGVHSKPCGPHPFEVPGAAPRRRSQDTGTTLILDGDALKTDSKFELYAPQPTMP
jgi:hypothetical protein